MARYIPKEQLHVLVARAIEEIGSTSVTNWRVHKVRVAGRSPTMIYEAVRSSVVRWKEISRLWNLGRLFS